MNPCKRLCVLLALVLVALSGGCVTTGSDVVQVTTVQDSAGASLKAEDKAKLEEMKRAREESVDPGLSTMLQETPRFTVNEYLAKYRKEGVKPGQDYKVGGYDVLNITVYEEKDLSRDAVRVSADGYISFPLIGRIQVDNRTTSEIEKIIARKLAEGRFLREAHVSVMVTEYKSRRYLVLGAVKTPGSFPLQAQERLLDGLSRAEGVATDKAGKSAMIVRTENPGTPRERKIVISVDLQGLLKGRDQISNIFLMDKDMIYIPMAEYFYIIGQVRKPGSFMIPDREITLVEAISMAEGFTPIAARNRTRIIRVEGGVEKIIQVKVDAITEAGMKIQDVIIQPNDVIVVPESFF
ncbi:MAG: polysaccharide biosynthesis/export family protein [Deltaproteobacteria bacterium]|nr:polysaccharide biosynthesis/export family protein [Deltaproteobacteria bacterium]